MKYSSLISTIVIFTCTFLISTYSWCQNELSAENHFSTALIKLETGSSEKSVLNLSFLNPVPPKESILSLFGLSATPGVGFYWSNYSLPSTEYFKTDFLDYGLLDPSITLTLHTPIIGLSRNINYPTLTGTKDNTNIQILDINPLGLLYLERWYLTRQGHEVTHALELYRSARLSVLLPFYRKMTINSENYFLKERRWTYLAGFIVRSFIEEVHDDFYLDYNGIVGSSSDLKISYYKTEVGVTEGTTNVFIDFLNAYSGMGLELFGEGNEGFMKSWFVFPYAQLYFGKVFVESGENSNLGRIRYSMDYGGWKAGAFIWWGKTIGQLQLYGIAVAYPFSRMRLSDFSRTENIPLNQEAIKGWGQNYFAKIGITYHFF